MTCEFDPKLVVSEKQVKEDKKARGTITPIVTIMLLILGTSIGTLIYFKEHIQHQIMKVTKEHSIEEQEESMGELEVMELDPFNSDCRNVKTFSVRNDIGMFDPL